MARAKRQRRPVLTKTKRTPEDIAASNAKVIANNPGREFGTRLAAAADLLTAVEAAGLNDVFTTPKNLVRLVYGPSTVRLNKWARVSIDSDEISLHLRPSGYKPTGWGAGVYSWSGPDNLATTRIMRRLKKLAKEREQDVRNRNATNLLQDAAMVRAEALATVLRAMLGTDPIVTAERPNYGTHARVKVQVGTNSFSVEESQTDGWNVAVGRGGRVALCLAQSSLLNLMVALSAANPGKAEPEED